MHFISDIRYNPRIQGDDQYYRIKESYRDETGNVKTCLMLNLGFMDEKLCPEDIRDIGKCLTYFMKNGTGDGLFGNTISEFNDTVQRKAREYWRMMVQSGSIDRILHKHEIEHRQAQKLIDVESIQHTDARETGAEWVCLQTIKELGIDKFLENEGWSKSKIDTSIAHLVTRTIYNSSELKSMRIMDNNSSICELISGDTTWRPGFHSVYNVALDLYKLKDRLEDFLCRRTDTLFNITNSLILYDLTYTE